MTREIISEIMLLGVRRAWQFHMAGRCWFVVPRCSEEIRCHPLCSFLPDLADACDRLDLMCFSFRHMEETLS